MNVLLELIPANMNVSTLWEPMNVLVQEVSGRWETGVWMLMNVLNNKDFVQDQELVKTLMAASNVSVQEDTDWMNLELFALTEMSVKKMQIDVRHQNVETWQVLTSESF